MQSDFIYYEIFFEVIILPQIKLKLFQINGFNSKTLS